MLHREIIRVQAYESSTEKNEFHYLYKKDDKKGNNVTEKNGGIIDYGIDFMNCEIISAWIR